MKKHYFAITLLILSVFAVFLSCGSDDSDEYKELSPVVVDLSTVPYPKLSDYKFFTGEMKNLEPAYKVLPYDLNSSLFTDYALKKRFVWMPEGTQATYSSDGEVLNFPTGAALIKNFYYNNVLPGNVTKIIETRIMIKKADGWIFANYIWNNEQTEAFLDMNGSSLSVSWMQNGEEMAVNYKIPSQEDCTKCHSFDNKNTPIGPKPHNLFKNFNYASGIKNQLLKWQEEGYLSNVPSTVTPIADWTDTTQSLDLRARSYLAVNCGHCHNPKGFCEDTPLNLTFEATTDSYNLGICVMPHHAVTGNQKYIIAGQDARMSLMYFKMNTNIQEEMMPPVGRSTVHTEGVLLIQQWINSMEQPCP